MPRKLLKEAANRWPRFAPRNDQGRHLAKGWPMPDGQTPDNKQFSDSAIALTFDDVLITAGRLQRAAERGRRLFARHPLDLAAYSR